VAGRQLAESAAEQPHQSIASIDAAHGRAGLRWLAALVDFSGGDAGNPDPWAFSAPDWAVTVPDGRRSA